ncbi:MAG: VWA domain-containing protein [Gammaproteobacteria bacterium]|jgi:type IV pilus assembly protein PilY1|nr:VWA domain-containing protein [Gammaproteobacteria bacterium]
MFRSISKKISHSLVCFTLVFCSSGYADDIEIYFSSGSTSGNTGEAIRPNVLFILDTSGSMTASIPEAGGQSRVNVMKDAVKQVINDVEDINVGLMRFTSGSGGPVLFPITYVEDDISTVVGESPVVGTLSYENQINDGGNDAEENLTDNSVTTTGTALEVFEINRQSASTTNTVTGSNETQYSVTSGTSDGYECTGGGNCTNSFTAGEISRNSRTLDLRYVSSTKIRKLAVRFNAVSLTPNTLIEEARVDFRIIDKKTGTTNAVITGELAVDPPGLSSSDFDISSRTETTASVNWNGIAAANKHAKVTTPDIKTIIQEIVSQGCTNPPAIAPDTTGCTYGGDDIVIFVEPTTGRRKFKSRDNSSSKSPKLRISATTSTTTTTTVDTHDDNLVGFRFENIRIPKDATIESASLVFVPDETDTSNTVWSIKAEDIGDSPEFVSTASNLSGRTLTSAEAKWTVPDWTDGISVETTNTHSSNKLKSVLQEVVNRSDWCGGNTLSLFVTAATNQGTSLRKIESQEGSSSTGVKLKYSFTSGSTGCYAASESAQVGIEQDDAEQSGTVVNITDIDLDLGVDTVGVRFQGVDVPNGAVITEATLSFYAKSTSTGAASFSIKAELEDSAVQFSNAPSDITGRSLTPDGLKITWVPDDWDVGGELHSTADITTLVKATVDRTGWVSGGNMVFVVEPGTGTRVAESINSDPARGPRLNITYEDTADTFTKTVRERLIEVVDDLPASGGTPVQETMHEAALYWRGQDMRWGKSRASSSSARLSHPAAYCKKNADGTLDCRGATVSNTGLSPDSDEYGVQNPSGCPENTNLNDYDCRTRQIAGTPTYISPFSSSLTCQNNYQVLLTDGSANSGSTTSQGYIRTTMNGAASCLANNSTIKQGTDIAHSYGTSEKCTVDLTKFLKENDQSTATVGENLSNDQTVSTYTIGFNLGTTSSALANVQFLKDIANVGAGEFFEATTAGSLVDVFTSILTDVKSDPTSFVSPSLATNAFNRLLSRDEVYFGLFTPSLNKSWLGNVKKYNICIDSSTGCSLGTFLDATGAAAIDPSNDKFKETAKSLWSDVVDGRDTTKGGSGAEIADYTNTILYTEVNDTSTATSATPLSNTGFNMTSANWNDSDHDVLRAAVCTTVSTTAGSDCEDRMLWLLGKKIVTDADNDINTTQRWSTNDVLHSSPAVITYGGEDDDNDGIPSEAEDSDGLISTFYDKILFGTNDGALHMVNGFDGTEDWRFIPSEFWTNQQTMFTNPEGSHVYGLDLTPTLYNVDHDSDGTIETADSDFVYAYMGSRRGGKGLYALNLTDDITSKTDTLAPKLMWHIKGGVTSGYSRMGYTWSQPTLADIATTTGNKKVLIFGGGYDTALDSTSVFAPADNAGNDFLGNAIYIVDPLDGSLIFSVSGTGSGANVIIPDMHYSIPSSVSVADSNGDGIDDRVYVGDTGGQVWRIDLGSDIQQSGGLLSTALCLAPCTKTVIGKLASIADGSDSSKERRFFEAPSVVQVRDELYAATGESDYDYVMIGSGYTAHPLNTTVKDRFYAFRDRYIGGLLDADNDHRSELADGYADGSGGAIDNSNLFDATASVLTTADATKTADGWYYDFFTAGTTGEKVLSSPTSVAGGVSFTTFKPGAETVSNPCEGTLGGATAYNFDILSANAFLDWDGDGDVDINDRKLALGGGIPSDVVPVFTKEGVVGIVGIEGGASQLGVLSGLPRFRTYYYEGG